MELNLKKKQICRVILLERDQAGTLVPETLWKAKKKKRRTSRNLRPVDRVVRSAAKSQKAFGETLLKRHRRSNKKHKNGGLQDLSANLFRASRRANKASR